MPSKPESQVGLGIVSPCHAGCCGALAIRRTLSLLRHHDHFPQIAPFLDCIRREGSNKDMETWGRISALAALTGHIDFTKLLGELNTLEIAEAWQGAARVWTHPENIKHHREQCLAGIEAGINADSPHAVAVARQAGNIFRCNTPPISIPIELIHLCFRVFENDSEHKHHPLFGWMAQRHFSA